MADYLANIIILYVSTLNIIMKCSYEGCGVPAEGLWRRRRTHTVTLSMMTINRKYLNCDQSAAGEGRPSVAHRKTKYVYMYIQQYIYINILHLFYALRRQTPLWPVVARGRRRVDGLYRVWYVYIHI